MNRLADTSLVGGERSDATDHCLAGIARLSNEVKDASSYIPTYDQRIYAEVGLGVYICLIMIYVLISFFPRLSRPCRTN
jgi:hypothetical protein